MKVKLDSNENISPKKNDPTSKCYMQCIISIAKLSNKKQEPNIYIYMADS